MSDPTLHPVASVPPDDALSLIVRFHDNLLSPSEFDALERLLESSPDARKLFVTLAAQSHALREVESSAAPRSLPPVRSASADRPHDTFSPPRTPTLSPPRAKRLVLPALPLAASLLLAACGLAIFLLNLKPETRNPKPPASPLATILDTSDNATLTINDTIANPGDETRPGVYTLSSGSADFRLNNGVTVRLTGDTRLTVHSPMSATLARGSATFDCPPNAKGYTVHLPGGARVVDLGTRFELRVEPDGARTLTVLVGSVAVHPAAHANPEPAHPDAEPAHADAEPAAGEASGTSRIILAGQTATLDPAGSVASIVPTDSINLLANGSFESPRTGAAQPWGDAWELTRDHAGLDPVPEAGGDSSPPGTPTPGALHPWRITGSGKWLFGPAYWKPADGRHALSLHNYPNQRTVAEQSADVLPDQPCELRFHLAGRFDAPDQPTTQSLRVTILDGDLPVVDRVLVAERPADFDRLAAPGWTAHALRFTPQSARVTVRFQSAEQSHPYGALVDAVGLFAVIEPPPPVEGPDLRERSSFGDSP